MSELTLTSTKLPSHINTDSGRGNEEVTANAVPRIKQLQRCLMNVTNVILSTQGFR